MRPAQTNNDASPDDLSLVAARRLVAYEEAKAAGNGIPFVRPVEASAGEPLASDLACVDLLHRVWPDFDLPPQVDDACLPTKTLGDFRLIRELGRGGMGTVYEAKQLSMGRHVALKVLPFAALVDDKSLRRFRNEVLRGSRTRPSPYRLCLFGGRRTRRPLLRDAAHSRADAGRFDRGVAKKSSDTGTIPSFRRNGAQRQRDADD